MNRKRAQRLMRLMGLESVAPKPNTSKPNEEHPVYPYLLRGLTIDRPNQVWAADITYIPLARGFAYLVASMDWHSRRVLSWRLSNTLDTSFCLEALQEALSRFGRPEIFNSDQGSQFTAKDFTDVLLDEGVKISMDGRGRCTWRQHPADVGARTHQRALHRHAVARSSLERLRRRGRRDELLQRRVRFGEL